MVLPVQSPATAALRYVLCDSGLALAVLHRVLYDSSGLVINYWNFLMILLESLSHFNASFSGKMAGSLSHLGPSLLYPNCSMAFS